MRRIVTWALSTLTVLVLLLSYHTSTSSSIAPSEQVAAAGARSAGAGAGPAQGAPGASSGPSSGSGTAQGAGTTVAGNAVDTPFGPVQVQIAVSNGKITGADVLQVPDRQRRDQLINGRAVPILNQEAVAAQSAKVDMVSGATYTSEGYVQSLQSAIDQAHL